MKMKISEEQNCFCVGLWSGILMGSCDACLGSTESTPSRVEMPQTTQRCCHSKEAGRCRWHKSYAGKSSKNMG
jgi:hypothetical protein